MKLIFLDIDGVMTSPKSSLYVENSAHSSTLLHHFDPRCVKVLNYIIKRSNARIVLTSSWRLVHDAEEQDEIFAANGVTAGPVGGTVDLGYENQADEIRQYLKKKAVEAFVILDDMTIDGFENNFVQINPVTGLNKLNLPQIFAFLNTPEQNQPPA